MKKIKFVKPVQIDLNKNAYEGMELYKKSLVDGFITLGKFSNKQSPHVIGADPDIIFNNGFTKDILKAMYPLVTIDLNALNDKFNAKIPTVYHEHPSIEWIVTKLDDEGKVEEMQFFDCKRNVYGVEALLKKYQDDQANQKNIRYFEDAERIVEAFEVLKNAYYHILKDEMMPSDVSLNSLDDYLNYTSDWEQRFLKREISDGSRYVEAALGPYPDPVHTDFTYPVIEETDDAFYFVTTLLTRAFNLAPYTYYVFYNPEERMVAQLMQMT